MDELKEMLRNHLSSALTNAEAEIIAQRAVCKAFDALGVDLHDHPSRNALRDDLVFLRRLRTDTSKAGTITIATVLTTVIGALVVAIWIGIKGALH